MVLFLLADLLTWLPCPTSYCPPTRSLSLYPLLRARPKPTPPPSCSDHAPRAQPAGRHHTGTRASVLAAGVRHRSRRAVAAGLQHAHGGQVARGGVQACVPAVAPRVRLVLRIPHRLGAALHE
eukprot:6173659-Pleurochrysis_carterae.AAC.4